MFVVWKGRRVKLIPRYYKSLVGTIEWEEGFWDELRDKNCGIENDIKLNQISRKELAVPNFISLFLILNQSAPKFNTSKLNLVVLS